MFRTVNAKIINRQAIRIQNTKHKMRLYRHISLFRILSNPCNKQGLHSTARHFIPDNSSNASNPPGNEAKVLSQNNAYDMVKQMNEIDRDHLRCALNQFELDQIKIKFEGKV